MKNETFGANGMGIKFGNSGDADREMRVGRGDIAAIAATARTEQGSCSGCLSGSDSWGSSFWGWAETQPDGCMALRRGETWKPQWVRLDVPSRAHAQNNRPTGWESTGVSSSEGTVGLSPVWKGCRWIVRLYVSPEIYSGNRYLGKEILATYWSVPRAVRRAYRNSSVAA